MKIKDKSHNFKAHFCSFLSSAIMKKGGHVYIVSNTHRTTFYIGITFNLTRRTWEHKSGVSSGFTTKYDCIDLVYYAFFGRITKAINREKQLKKWKRSWKIELIKDLNPDMNDLYEEIAGTA